ncbi:MAG: ATPase, partial [Clostridia bacterium]|nr:ATPase [Clostridia bacterium]
MKHYLFDGKAVLEEVKSNENGLTQQEAEARLEQNGKNKLAEGKKISMVKRFFMQLANPMIIVLIIAAVVSLITTLIPVMSGSGHFDAAELAEFFIIIGVVLLNAILGVVQEGKAEKAIEALKEMTASTCKVIRDGVIKIIKNEDLVVGDIVVLEAGDSVPADCRLIESASLKAEEA